MDDLIALLKEQVAECERYAKELKAHYEEHIAQQYAADAEFFRAKREALEAAEKEAEKQAAQAAYWARAKTVRETREAVHEAEREATRQREAAEATKCYAGARHSHAEWLMAELDKKIAGATGRNKFDLQDVRTGWIAARELRKSSRKAWAVLGAIAAVPTIFLVWMTAFAIIH